MNISKEAFTQWTESIAPDATLLEICTKAHLSPSTISEQRSGNRITPKTIIAIARAYGLSPVRELSGFDGYESLKERGGELALAQAVPLYSALDLLHQRFAHQGTALPLVKLTPLTHPLKRWLEVNRGSASQKDLATQIGMHPSNFSRQVSGNSLPTYRIIELAAIMNTSPAPGMVATGELTFLEAFGAEQKTYLEQAPQRQLLTALEVALAFVEEDVQESLSS